MFYKNIESTKMEDISDQNQALKIDFIEKPIVKQVDKFCRNNYMFVMLCVEKF